MGKSNKNKGWGNRGSIPMDGYPEEETYRVYEYEDKDKKKKRFKLKVSNPAVVNYLGDSIFGGRYYTLSEDPTYTPSN